MHLKDEHFATEYWKEHCLCGHTTDIYHELVAHFIREHTKKIYISPCGYGETKYEEAIKHAKICNKENGTKCLSYGDFFNFHNYPK